MCQRSLGAVIVLAALLSAGVSGATDLDSNCTVSVQNRTVRARPDGTWIIANAPANVGQVRARATCVGQGVTRSGQSDFFVVPADGSLTLPAISLGAAEPVPASINVLPREIDLGAAGEEAQLTVTAIYPNFSRRNVTAAAEGTSYSSSNPAIASVDAEGLVRANGSGAVLVSVTNQGSLAVVRVRSALGGQDSDGDGIPDDVELANRLNPNDPTDALEDRDGDGLGNKQELIDFGTDLDDPDSDGDGLADGEETVAGSDGFVTDPLLADTDGDGIRDALEIATGTDPTDPSSFDLAAALTSIEVSPQIFVLTFNSLDTEVSRQLAVTGNLSDGTTIDLTSTARGTNYESSDIAVCNFGATDGEVFAGIGGSCTVSVGNSGFEVEALGIVRTFAPVARGFVAVPGFANGVDAVGDYAFVAAGATGLQVLDVSNPAAPTVAASANTPGNANDVAVVGGLAYVADGSAGLQIVDVANPLSPAIIGAAATPGTAWSVAVDGSTAYVAAGAAGLALIDVGDPMAPAPLGGIATAGTAKGVAVDAARQLAIVAGGTAGLHVVDVADPMSPSLLSTAAIGGDARAVALDDMFAFVADAVTSFTAVDLSAPSSPVVEASTPQATGGLLQDVVVAGNIAFGADFFFVNGVPIVDVGVPEAPLPRAILDFSALRDDNGTGIDADQSFAYLTAATTITENGTTGNTRLYIGEYKAEVDGAGVPPTVAISSPADGATLVAGSNATLIAIASDDVAVAAVAFLVDGEIAAVDLSAPFQTALSVPSGVGDLTLGAIAIDGGENVGVAADVTVSIVTAPSTDVTGVVLDRDGLPAAGAAVLCNGVPGLVHADGSFSVEIFVVAGHVRCVATMSGIDAALAGVSGSVAPVASGETPVGVITANRPAPRLIEPGWAIAELIVLPAAQSAHFNPVDGLLYVGRREASGGLYRIGANGSATLLHGSEFPAAIVIDPDDGDIFVSEDFDGIIYRTAFGATTRSTWVSGLHAGDDDPLGMAIAPNSYLGGVINPGEALVVDSGANSSPDAVFRFSPDTAEGEVQIVGDASALVDALDVAIGEDAIYIVDSGDEFRPVPPVPGTIYRLEAGGVLVQMPVQRTLLEPSAIAIDPLSGEILVVEFWDGALYRIDASTGAVETVALGITEGWFAGLDITADGNRMAITGGGAVFVLQRTVDPDTTVSGTVVDAEGNAIGGATVVCGSVSGVTAGNGSFILGGVPALRGRIACTASFVASDGKLRTGEAGGVAPVAAGVTALGPLVAAEVYKTDFQQTSTGWSTSAVDYTPNSRRRFLGQFLNQTVTLALADLPAHELLTVQADVFAIRSWDGNLPPNGPDVWRLSVDGSPILNTTFGGQPAYPGQYPGQTFPSMTAVTESRTLGFVFNNALADGVFRISLSVPHSSAAATIAFNASGLLSLADESWGLDNVTVSLGPAPGPIVDVDQDGLADAGEGPVGCISPLRRDTDQDGIADGDEDCDGDGLTNASEISVFGTSSTSLDSDGDTIGDFEETVPGADGWVTNPANADTDGDGFDDAVEIAAGRDPTDPDDTP